MKKIFLLGDIVALHYSPYLEEYLKEDYEILTKPGREEALVNIYSVKGANGGDSLDVLTYVKELERDGKLDFDIFLFNCGLHDVKRQIPEENIQISLGEYTKNLSEIFKIMSKHDIKCVFVTTTPIYEEAHNEQIPNGIKRHNADIVLYNKAAIREADKYNAYVIDLYGFLFGMPEDPHIDYAYFKFPTRKLTAAYISGYMQTMI